MTATVEPAQVTLAEGAIHNPKDPRHFMRIKPAGRRVRILRDGMVLAETDAALRLLEAGRDMYDPVLYLPRSGIRAELAPAAKDPTFCPIKGHASYFDLVSDEGRIDVAEIAWSYEETLDCAAELKDLIAFDASQVVIEEHPLEA